MPDREQAAELIHRHAVAVATLRAFGRESKALRVLVVADQGDSRQATMLEWDADDSVAITADGATAHVGAETVPAAAPLPIEPGRPVPATAIEFDVIKGEVLAPIGAVANLALGVLDLARAFGGRTVATADFATRSGDPLTIAARDGEPLMLAIGGEQFELAVAPPDR